MTTVVMGLLVWFTASVPVGLIVGRLLARANRVTFPSTADSTTVQQRAFVSVEVDRAASTSVLGD